MNSEGRTREIDKWIREWTMFDVYCPGCDAVVLLGPRRIRSLRNTPQGIAVTYRCYCGTEGTEVTGRHASAPSPRVAVAL